MNMQTFWLLASPTTLASLITDIDHTDHVRDDVAKLRELCHDELTANVGDDEAARLLTEAGAGR
tara:strand:- start:641 stop:832 length:192 start_codon:yes stop_codon:yes gene_type:complete